MLLGYHYMHFYHMAFAMNQYFANRGYVVLSVNYRSGIGYGMEFREAERYGATGASEFNDVLGAGLYAASTSSSSSSPTRCTDSSCTGTGSRPTRRRWTSSSGT